MGDCAVASNIFFGNRFGWFIYVLVVSKQKGGFPPFLVHVVSLFRVRKETRSRNYDTVTLPALDLGSLFYPHFLLSAGSGRV